MMAVVITLMFLHGVIKIYYLNVIDYLGLMIMIIKHMLENIILLYHKLTTYLNRIQTM